MGGEGQGHGAALKAPPWPPRLRACPVGPQRVYPDPRGRLRKNDLRTTQTGRGQARAQPGTGRTGLPSGSCAQPPVAPAPSDHAFLRPASRQESGVHTHFREQNPCPRGPAPSPALHRCPAPPGESGAPLTCVGHAQPLPPWGGVGGGRSAHRMPTPQKPAPCHPARHRHGPLLRNLPGSDLAGGRANTGLQTDAH